MPTNTDTTKNTDTSMKETLSQGEEASSDDGENTEEEETTAEGVYENNPEDNKKLSEITMMEELRKTFNLTLTIPRILKKLHTNQFFFIDVTDEFYEKNYPTIISAIANTKFARFAGFQKGRFFVEKVEEKGGMDGWETKITLNPIPPSYALYSQKQKAAQKALIQAINYEISLIGSSGGDSGLNSSVVSSDLIGIGNELASKYTFCGQSGSESYTTMKERGCGSCFAWSGALYTELTAKGYQVRVVEYTTNLASNHRSVEINVNGTWEDYPYRSTNIPTNARNTNNKNRRVLSDSELQSIL